MFGYSKKTIDSYILAAEQSSWKNYNVTESLFEKKAGSIVNNKGKSLEVKVWSDETRTKAVNYLHSAYNKRLLSIVILVIGAVACAIFAEPIAAVVAVIALAVTLYQQSNIKILTTKFAEQAVASGQTKVTRYFSGELLTSIFSPSTKMVELAKNIAQPGMLSFYEKEYTRLTKAQVHETLAKLAVGVEDEEVKRVFIIMYGAYMKEQADKQNPPSPLPEPLENKLQKRRLEYMEKGPTIKNPLPVELNIVIMDLKKYPNIANKHGYECIRTLRDDPEELFNKNLMPYMTKAFIQIKNTRAKDIEEVIESMLCGTYQTPEIERFLQLLYVNAKRMQKEAVLRK